MKLGAFKIGVEGDVLYAAIGIQQRLADDSVHGVKAPWSALFPPSPGHRHGKVLSWSGLGVHQKVDHTQVGCSAVMTWTPNMDHVDHGANLADPAAEELCSLLRLDAGAWKLSMVEAADGHGLRRSRLSLL